MRQTINLRQMACMAGVLVFANKVLVLPSLFYDEVGVDGIFLLLAFFLVDLALFGVFFWIKERFPTDTFFSILSKVLTKYGAIFVYVLFCGFFLIKALSSFNISLMYLKNQVYFEVGEYVFLLCFLTITNNMVFKGLRSTARTTEFFYIFILILVVFCDFASVSNYAGIPVMFNTSISKLLSSSFSYVFWFGDALFFFLIMDKIELKKTKKTTVFVSVSINMVLVFILHAVYYSIFRYTGFMHNNAASDVISVTNNFSAIGRIDIVAVIAIMILNYFQLAIYNIAFDSAFSAVFRSGNKLFSIVIYDLLFVILLLFFIKDFTVALWFGGKIMPYVALLLQYIVPLIGLSACLFQKRRRANE